MCGAAAQAAVTLSVTPGSVNFTYMQGAILPAAKTVSVKLSSGTGTYTATVMAGTPWLTVSPDAGTLPATPNVRVNPTGLTVGTYTGQVIFTSLAAGAPGTANVSLIVTAPVPALKLSGNSLSFTGPPAPPSQTLLLSTTGGSIQFSAAATPATWLSVIPTNAVVLPGAPVTLTVSVDPTLLPPQAAAYTGKITITATGSTTATKTQNITISFAVNYAQPTITSVWPSTSQIGAAATTVTIRGTNFAPATTAKIRGVPAALVTTYYSPTTLSAVIPASQLASAATLDILTNNPNPGGASAATVPFIVSAVPTVDAAVSAASYVGPSVATGELITLFGAGIGPAIPAFLTDADVNGYVDMTLGGVDVTVDGIAAPMIYVSQNQITVQVPYEVSAGAGKAIVVTNGAIISNGAADIVATVPGIFTLDASGGGQAAALNFSVATSQYSLNSAAKPAKIGDIVILYLTGEGAYAGTILTPTGYIVPIALSPLPQMSPLPTVTIAGASATVNYAGPLPGAILGVLQINAVVPAGITTSAATQVVVTIGGIATQANVTISTKP